MSGSYFHRFPPGTGMPAESRGSSPNVTSAASIYDKVTQLQTTALAPREL